MAQYCRDTPSAARCSARTRLLRAARRALPAARLLDLVASVPRVTVYRRADVLDALQLDELLLSPASLVGNDFVPTDMLDAFHRALVGPTAARRPAVILAVAAHFRSAAASRLARRLPLPPLLWDALDFARRLPEGGKALVERSLEQCSSEAFAELPARWRELAAPALGGDAALLPRRSPRSAIFTAAARGAIWRGPGLDLSLSNGEAAGVAAAILASRPVRAEIYALRRAAGCRRRRGRRRMRCASLWCTQGRRRRGARYRPCRRRAARADWRCRATARARLLRSLARASADDALLARADPRPHHAWPAPLALPTTRSWAARASRAASARLPQAVVMAWLSHRRQQLPEAAAPAERTRCARFTRPSLPAHRATS